MNNMEEHKEKVINPRQGIVVRTDPSLKMNDSPEESDEISTLSGVIRDDEDGIEYSFRNQNRCVDVGPGRRFRFIITGSGYAVLICN
jgi:hypothetical protein